MINYKSLAVLFLSMVLFIGWAKKDPEKAPPATGPAEAQGVQHKVLSFNLEGLTQKGTKSWEVNGESAEAISQDRIQLNNIVAKAYGEEAEATITADRGIYDKSGNNVTLEQNVKATIMNSEGFSEEYTSLASPLASADTKPKRGKPDDNEKKKVVITCDGEVQFDYAKNQGYFNKNVRVASDDGNIEADRITMNLDPTTKKILNIIAEGSVKITRGENVTYSDRAMYIEAEKKIVLTGSPKLIIYQEGGIEEGFVLPGNK